MVADFADATEDRKTEVGRDAERIVLVARRYLQGPCDVPKDSLQEGGKRDADSHRDKLDEHVIVKRELPDAAEEKPDGGAKSDA